MSGSSVDGPFHVTVNANVQLTDRHRFAGADSTQLAAALGRLITAHAWEAGLEITDPDALQVSVTPV